MANATGSDPLDGEPGPRLRGARRAATKGLLAHALRGLLTEASTTQAKVIEHSSPDGEHYIDGNYLSDILNAKAFPDYDTFANIIDALIELGLATFYVVKHLDTVYTAECIAWDRIYRATSGRVSETRRPDIRTPKRTEGSQGTRPLKSSREFETSGGEGGSSAGEGGFEPPIT